MNNLTTNTTESFDEIVDKQLHPLAKEQATKLVNELAITLVLQAKTLAFREKAELVLKRHIDESLEFILHHKKREWISEFLKIIGGALIGAFVPGLITSLPANDITSTIIYIVLGFAGMIMVFIGLSL